MSIEIRFQRRAPDPSIESAIQRWVARLEGMHLEVGHATVTVQQAGRRQTSIAVLVERCQAVATTHDDPYVAVSDAFRELRRNLLARGTLSPPMR